ncbi:hypothetical protein GUITHDRAFT_160098 [Guillardia theta CCMP2712]|uniref:Pre-mRNA-splicing factor Syf1-like N-terminal HAT-repeats domain-containing protein n=1 Tax=Guillardia theta (strain CCMP2712) TaxID=905079 RepID=L1IPB1_GUITC|nr:hypothetical protein GUITHDRAFT_160098 [Guillardia theta CCMP2712]EKX37719.1 hypothetical protein GUITHDRAFT_160098 [Guillardia theta CCMP2712]|eukprot:XP_005824699.1 hypothetical protein GUITHDRAFT_160098 [Guillardia theta CCMP2712]
MARVKNKQPAPVQITAEQILREAKERQEEDPKPPKQKITDPDELADYRQRKRKEFEDGIRRNRNAIPLWVKYAMWEETQLEFDRARSVWERALEIDSRNVTIWLKYAEMEMRHRNINRARNIWDRAVAILPRVDQFWYKYAYMEEMLGNVAGARQIFDRWMQWVPEDNAWTSYIKMELRYREVERAREIFERFISVAPKVSTWMKYAKFETKHGTIPQARNVYERAIEDLGEFAYEPELLLAFAKFEEQVKESERARAIYKFALDNIPKSKANELYQAFVAFEKQHGDREGIEDVIVSKRRFQYEEEVKEHPYNYDAWFDYVRLEEANGDAEKVREVYERAIAQKPPSMEKRAWRRYVYLWIYYAVFEEVSLKDVERARLVYREALKVIPHSTFTFAKLWVMAAQLEIRQKDLAAARKVLGRAIGTAPKEKIFKSYIEMELQLGNIDRVRMIYEKQLECFPANCRAWTAFGELEQSLGELDRARAIFELGISQSLLDMPEVLWKAYIDFEVSEGETQRARALYSRLLERTSHVKEERVLLLDSWLAMEEGLGEAGDPESVRAKQPKQIKKKRPIQNEEGQTTGWEEYFDYIFPDEQKPQALKILEMAHKWKKQKTDE